MQIAEFKFRWFVCGLILGLGIGTTLVAFFFTPESKASVVVLGFIVILVAVLMWISSRIQDKKDGEYDKRVKNDKETDKIIKELSK